MWLLRELRHMWVRGLLLCVSGTPSAPLLPGPMPSPPTGLGGATMPAPLGSAGSAPRATSPGAYTIPGPPSPAGGATGAPSARSRPMDQVVQPAQARRARGSLVRLRCLLQGREHPTLPRNRSRDRAYEPVPPTHPCRPIRRSRATLAVALRSDHCVKPPISRRYRCPLSHRATRLLRMSAIGGRPVTNAGVHASNMAAPPEYGAS